MSGTVVEVVKYAFFVAVVTGILILSKFANKKLDERFGEINDDKRGGDKK